MRRRVVFALGLLLYTFLLAVLLRFDMARMVQPVPLLSVLAGMVILTAFQYKKGITWGRVVLLARWNAFVAGLLTTLLQLLSLLTDGHAGMEALAGRLIPLVYGSLICLVIDLIQVPRGDETSASEQDDPFSAETAQPLLVQRGFSPRECHVALALLRGRTNKEIAAELYISEATVKKHIQNMYKKCGAADRQDFVTMYIRWAKADRQDAADRR
jgi:DNA-binding CsgD family transcriptional regulator